MTRTAAWKLLIADDHAELRQTLRALLSPVASEIREAADGAEAVRIFTEQQPDWVIMDIRMEPVGGLEATREIRRNFPNARIITVTQYDDDELHGEALLAGACVCLLKENLAAVLQLIGGSSHGLDLRSEPSSTNNKNNIKESL